MTLTKEKLKSLYEKKYQKESDIEKRYEAIEKVIEKTLKEEFKVTIDENNNVKIGFQDVEYKNDKDESVKPQVNYFAPERDHMTVDQAYSGVEKMSNKFENFKDLVNAIGCILGGFDFSDKKMLDKYRIISNSITSTNDYNNTLTSLG